jgi:hypothetical protein
MNQSLEAIVPSGSIFKSCINVRDRDRAFEAK